VGAPVAAHASAPVAAHVDARSTNWFVN
jgi:hypothetical protein